MKGDQMDGACSTCRRDVNNILVGKKRKGRDLLENQVIDERVILE
jgi:ferredoxin